MIVIRVRVCIPYGPIGKRETIDDDVVITVSVGAGFARRVVPRGNPESHAVLAYPGKFSKRIEDRPLTGVRLENDRMCRFAKVHKRQHRKSYSKRRGLAVRGCAGADENEVSCNGVRSRNAQCAPRFMPARMRI